MLSSITQFQVCHCKVAGTIYYTLYVLAVLCIRITARARTYSSYSGKNFNAHKQSHREHIPIYLNSKETRVGGFVQILTMCSQYIMHDNGSNICIKRRIRYVDIAAFFSVQRKPQCLWRMCHHNKDVDRLYTQSRVSTQFNGKLNLYCAFNGLVYCVVKRYTNILPRCVKQCEYVYYRTRFRLLNLL